MFSCSDGYASLTKIFYIFNRLRLTLQTLVKTRNMRSCWWMLFTLLFHIPVHAQSDSTILHPDTTVTIVPIQPVSHPVLQQYSRPKSFGFITNVPGDLWQLAKSPFQKKNLAGLGIVT